MSAPNRSNARDRRRKSVRPRPLPPEVNARNLAIEKRRRKDFNERFLVSVSPRNVCHVHRILVIKQHIQILARSIPGLDTTHKLTKNLIVDESIRELEQQRNLYMAAMQNIQDLTVENERLSMEVDHLRSQSLNFCACSGNTSIPAYTRPQMMGFHTGVGDNWLREVGNMYGSTRSANADPTGTALQGDYCPVMAEQSLQGGFTVQHHQTYSNFDESAFHSYLLDTTNRSF